MSLSSRLALLMWVCGLAGTVLAAPATCPAVADISAEQLQGQWLVQVTGQPRMWLLQLGPHPEHSGSLRGELDTGTGRYPVVADLDEGEFTLEETHDGQRIAATWLGSVLQGSCGQTIQGERLAQPHPTSPFVMRRNQAR